MTEKHTSRLMSTPVENVRCPTGREVLIKSVVNMLAIDVKLLTLNLGRFCINQSMCYEVQANQHDLCQRMIYHIQAQVSIICETWKRVVNL